MRLGLQTAPVWVLLLACDGKTVDWCGNPCVLDDAHNFTYQSELQIRQYTRQSGQDLTFDWSDLSIGLQQNLIDPTQDIDELVLVVFSELSQKMSRMGSPKTRCSKQMSPPTCSVTLWKPKPNVT